MKFEKLREEIEWKGFSQNFFPNRNLARQSIIRAIIMTQILPKLEEGSRIVTSKMYRIRICFFKIRVKNEG